MDVEQMSNEPLELLRQLAASGRTGELAFAAAEKQYHVYFQGGRIAWGAASTHPFAFARHMAQSTGLTHKQLTRLVAECRRERAALGETLVRRQLATREQVREALRYQASLTVRSLMAERRGVGEFFDRKGYASYDPRLTFPLDELLSVSIHFTSQTGLTGEPLARRVRAELSGVEWAECFERDSLVAHLGRARTIPATPTSLLSHLLHQGTDFVGLRTRCGAIFGARTPGNLESVWCGLSEDAPLGAAYALLNHVCKTEGMRDSTSRLARANDVKILHDDESALSATARALMKRAPDVLGVCHLVGERPASLIVRAERTSAVATERLAAFAEQVLEGTGGGSVASDCGDQDFRTAVIGEHGNWSFGTRLPLAKAESVWLVTSRDLPQGFGWACLNALAREVTQCSP